MVQMTMTRNKVLKYLARYTHRVAISNQRLLSVDGGKVTFRWKDYANGNRQRTMTLDAHEFLRRFLLHVLPKGFMRVRYYGFLANRNRAEKLARVRQLLGQRPRSTDSEPYSSHGVDDTSHADALDAVTLCPECKKGRLILIGELRPSRGPIHHAWSFDSS